MNPIAFSIGNISIYWYSLFILTAFIVGYFLVYIEIKKRHTDISLTFLSDFFFYLVPIAILGARTYYVIFEFDMYKDNLLNIFKIWEGGLAIHGGIIASIIFACYYTKKKGVNTVKLMDLAAPSLILGQAIGRWGNFFNQEAYGPMCTLEKLQNMNLPQFIINGMHINGAYYEPTFFYESLVCFIGFIILISLRTFYKKINIGTITGLYFIIYGTERCIVESLRQDSLMLGNIKVAQLVSIIMVLAGIIFIVMSCIKKVPFIENKELKKGKK